MTKLTVAINEPKARATGSNVAGGSWIFSGEVCDGLESIWRKMVKIQLLQAETELACSKQRCPYPCTPARAYRLEGSNTKSNGAGPDEKENG
jgi:hypothetical protein